MDVTQVVIHFIGLVLFSTQVSNDPGLHAILPAIHFVPPHMDHLPVDERARAMALEPSPGAAAAAAPVSVSPNIEPHMALLIFPENVVANDSQWVALPILSRFPHAKALASHKYVALTGEHITFVVDAPGNQRAKIPTNMPRLSCAATAKLTSGFQWPYAKAAAVVDIPKGELSACHASTVAVGRIDSRLVLKTTGTLTIVAAKSGVVKTLVLNTSTNPIIYLANVPPPQVKGTGTTTIGASHFLAYYSMIGKNQISTTRTCLERPVSKGGVPACETRRVFLAGLDGPLGTPSDFDRVGTIFSVNAECSNTQWP